MFYMVLSPFFRLNRDSEQMQRTMLHHWEEEQPRWTFKQAECFQGTFEECFKLLAHNDWISQPSQLFAWCVNDYVTHCTSKSCVDHVLQTRVAGFHEHSHEAVKFTFEFIQLWLFCVLTTIKRASLCLLSKFNLVCFTAILRRSLHHPSIKSNA